MDYYESYPDFLLKYYLESEHPIFVQDNQKIGISGVGGR